MPTPIEVARADSRGGPTGTDMKLDNRRPLVRPASGTMTTTTCLPMVPLSAASWRYMRPR